MYSYFCTQRCLIRQSLSVAYSFSLDTQPCLKWWYSLYPPLGSLIPSAKDKSSHLTRWQQWPKDSWPGWYCHTGCPDSSCSAFILSFKLAFVCAVESRVKECFIMQAAFGRIAEFNSKMKYGPFKLERAMHCILQNG